MKNICRVPDLLLVRNTTHLCKAKSSKWVSFKRGVEYHNELSTISRIMLTEHHSENFNSKLWAYFSFQKVVPCVCCYFML